MPTNIINRLDTREAQIGILGLGYVGLPIMLRYAEVGYPVLGFDIDPAKVEQLNAGHSDIEHISADSIQTARAKGFTATTDFTRARDCDALILCVPQQFQICRDGLPARRLGDDCAGCRASIMALRSP